MKQLGCLRALMVELYAIAFGARFTSSISARSSIALGRCLASTLALMDVLYVMAVGARPFCSTSARSSIT